LVLKFFIGYDDIERALKQSKEATLSKLESNVTYQYIGDTVEEIRWWACFQESQEPSARKPRINSQAKPESETQGRVPAVVIKPKRNKPCPCGNGKKYKEYCRP